MCSPSELSNNRKEGIFGWRRRQGKSQGNWWNNKTYSASARTSQAQAPVTAPALVNSLLATQLASPPSRPHCSRHFGTHCVGDLLNASQSYHHFIPISISISVWVPLLIFHLDKRVGPHIFLFNKYTLVGSPISSSSTNYYCTIARINQFCVVQLCLDALICQHWTFFLDMNYQFWVMLAAL